MITMLQIPVSLSEVLEVRSENGLSEAEILSILHNGIDPLETLIDNAKASSVRGMGLSPESVYFLPDGSVQLKPMPCEMLNEKFLPPEYAPDTKPGALLVDLDKVYVYAFGAVLSHVLEHGNKSSVISSSPELYSLLNLMTIRDPNVRLPLPKVAQMTEKYVKNNNVEPSENVKALFRSIMGSEEDFPSLSFDEFTRKPSVDVATGFSDEDFQAVSEFDTKLYNDIMRSTSNHIEIIELTSPKEQPQFQPKMSELERLNAINQTSSTVNGKKPLSFAAFGSKSLHAAEKDEPIGDPMANSTTIIDEKLIDLTEVSENAEAKIIIDKIPPAPSRSNWIDFEDQTKSDFGGLEVKRTSFKSDGFFSSSDDLDDSVFPSTAASRNQSVLLTPFTYDNLIESVSTPAMPLLSAAYSAHFPGKNHFEFNRAPLHPFDDQMDIFASTSDTKNTLNESAKVLERLMPTEPSEFTNPKDHGKLERNRIYHSVDCQFCSPAKRAVCFSEERYRRSLPNLFLDPDADVRRLYSAKANRSFDVRPTTFQTNAASHVSSASNISSPSGEKRFSRNIDPLFASFEKLAGNKTAEDDGDATSWHTLEIERPSSSSSMNSALKEPVDKPKVAARDFDRNSHGSLKNGQLGDDLFNNKKISFDEEYEFAPPQPRGSADVRVLNPIDENLVELEENADSTHRPTSTEPKVTLYEPRRSSGQTPIDGGDSPPSYGGRLSRENSMRVKTGSQRGSKRQRQPPFAAVAEHSVQERKISSNDSPVRSVPILGIQQSIGNSKQPKHISSTTTTSSHAPEIHVVPHHYKRKVSALAHQIQMPSANSEKIVKGPEFFFYSRQPSIRLKAPSAQRSKKLFRHPLEKSVLVILLNGQRVDVACRTDCTAENIFEAVSTHTNLNEWHFFGLSSLKDGEHFFLEPEQKLEKFAPPGWRNSSRDVVHARVIYTLYLRVKYYPVSLDFVKTEQTLHHIYLQLRRDVLDERLQCSKDMAYQLAALALQAEYGDPPWNVSDYFVIDHYLPHRHLIDEVGGEDRIRLHLAELHGQYAGTSDRDAETEFVKICQQLREYGIHFYRLYRSKPSQLLTPSPLGDPETGTSLWIGIMPRGVIIFEERGGERIPISQHPWHLTTTLQFDHKRFVIFPQTDNLDPNRPPPKVVYYTDNHKKSMYFVNFAATQHKFCMKMRLWAATLPIDGQFNSLERRPHLHINGHGENASNRSSATETDSGISREASPSTGEVAFAKMSSNPHERAVDANVPPRSTPILNMRAPKVPVQSLADVSIPSRDISTLLSPNETVSASLADRLEYASSPIDSFSGDVMTFFVTLMKDPHYGLGLTLVDGEIQGMKGVYVKSLTPGGPAELEGRLRVADKLISVNGQSLEGKSRHDAVDLVRQSSNEIVMGILRLKSIYSSNESINGGKSAETKENSSKGPPKSPRKEHIDSKDSTNILGVGVAVERKKLTPDMPRKIAESAGLIESVSNETPEKKLLGVQTPASYSYDTAELWLNDTNRSGGVSFQSNMNNDQKMYAGLHSDSEDSAASSDNEETSVSPHHRKRPPPRSSSSSASDNEKKEKAKFGAKKETLKADILPANILKLTKSSEKLNKDWTEQISLEEIKNADLMNNDLELFLVVMEKNENGSLGIQVAGGKGQKKVYIKSLVAEPAISASKAGKLIPGDQLASVNEKSTRGLSHQDVVNLLKNANSPVQLGLLRQRKPPQSPSSALSDTIGLDSLKTEKITIETLDVLLEKPASGSLGLSLAKPPGGEGIFIRVISPGSIAAVDGRLKVGDRLWMINGDSVVSASPTEVVEKLKAAQGFVKLVVKREVKEANNNNFN